MLELCTILNIIAYAAKSCGRKPVVEQRLWDTVIRAAVYDLLSLALPKNT